MVIRIMIRIRNFKRNFSTAIYGQCWILFKAGQRPWRRFAVYSYYYFEEKKLRYQESRNGFKKCQNRNSWKGLSLGCR